MRRIVVLAISFLFLVMLASCTNTDEDGKTPYIQEGYWHIDGVNTGVKAEGASGNSWSVGTEYPSDANVGDMMFNDVTFDIYQYDGESWEWICNIECDCNHGEKTEQKTVDLVIFVGQSNMAGRGTAQEPVPAVRNGEEGL